MKFTNYKNYMQATTGMIQSGWMLESVVIDGREVTTIQLYHDRLELSYTLEHHTNEETFEASELKPFVRNRRIGQRQYYEREHPFADALPVGASINPMPEPGDRPVR